MKLIKVIICIMFLTLSLSNPAQAGDKKESSTISDETLVLESGKRPIPGIQAYDANGNHLGLLVSIEIRAINIYDFKSRSIIRIDKWTGEISVSNGIFYGDSDCTGTVYLSANYMYRITEACGKYYTGQKVKPASTTYYSSLDLSSCECSSGTTTGTLVPAIEIDPQDISLFTPVALPLSFKAKIEPVDGD